MSILMGKDIVKRAFHQVNCVHIITNENVQIFVPYGSDVEELIHSLCYNGQSGGAGLEDFEVHLDKEGKVDLILGASGYTRKILAEAGN